MRVNFVCVWMGDKYGPEYPAILRDAVLRNASTMTHECAWWIITDRQDLPPGFNVIAPDPRYSGWWTKCQLFSHELPWEEGDRCVYFDLDVAITGRLEDLVERPGIIRDWHWPCANSSVMVWNHGEHSAIWDALTPERVKRPAGPTLATLLPSGEINGGDQELITELGGWDYFPSDWFVSYRSAKAWPTAGAKAVVFHGEPKPHDVTTGWVPNVWRVGGYTSLPEMTGVNTTEDLRLENVRLSIQRDLPWFTGFRDEGRKAVLVCGAPSMRDHIADIRFHARHGAQIVSVNNAWRFLVENGITPHVHVMLDARPENAEFVKDAPASMRYAIASQCHPDVFDALEGREVLLWHNAFGDSAALREVLAPFWDGPNAKPCILVPGGCTVGLRALWLLAFSGFRTIHAYGMDSSYSDSGAHHAYPQALNDGEQVLDVAMGSKTYRCAPWMVRQANEFDQTWRDLKAYVDPDGKPSPVTVHVHGKGLVPDIAKALRAEERAAA